MRYYNRTPTTNISYCESCFEKQRQIDQLQEETKLLRAKLKYRQDKDKEPFFGSSTPSSKISLKEDTAEINRKNKGGAKKGHAGNGRGSIREDEADEIIERPVEEDRCPHCQGALEYKETVFRSVVDIFLNKARNILYKCVVKRCVRCNRTVSNKPPILPGNKYGNNLIAQSAIMHYLHGIALKRLEDIWGENLIDGNLIKIFHRIACMWEPALRKLKEEYRTSPVKHADETSWRTDGENGYSWLFRTDRLSIFAFRESRSSRVAMDILGKRKLKGNR